MPLFSRSGGNPLAPVSLREASSFLILAFTRRSFSSLSSRATTCCSQADLSPDPRAAYLLVAGMFILGGRWPTAMALGAIILAGCVACAAGFLLLAWASLWPIILGACLTGVGGAPFSSIEAPAGAGRYPSQANGKRSRAEWFALSVVCGELGAVIGPVAGGVLE